MWPHTIPGVTLKFTWFNLMPWPHLAGDFRHPNRSVWGAGDAYVPVSPSSLPSGRA